MSTDDPPTTTSANRHSALRIALALGLGGTIALGAPAAVKAVGLDSRSANRCEQVVVGLQSQLQSILPHLRMIERQFGVVGLESHLIRFSRAVSCDSRSFRLPSTPVRPRADAVTPVGPADAQERRGDQRRPGDRDAARLPR